MIEAPVCLAMVLCNQAVREGKGLYSLLDVFWASEHETFPAIYPTFCIYAELTNFRGSGEITIRIGGEGVEPRIESKTPVDNKNPLDIFAVCVRCENVVFAHPGVYYVELIAAEEPIQERRLRVGVLKKPATPPPVEK